MKKSILQISSLTFFALFLLAGCGQKQEITQDPNLNPNPKKTVTQEQNLQEDQQAQVVLKQTLDLSNKYASLRYQTDNVLLNAEEFADYDAWNNEMLNIIDQWKTFENNSLTLEKLATEMAEEKISFNLIPQALAYDTEEVLNVINKAPMGKQVRTLANHLGVDAKMAQLILNQTQDQVTREAYGEEGDVFEKCEQNAMGIKNTAKVTVFVGGVILTGGTSAVMASGALAKTALVVSGADLALEVADDEARIALGDRNKVSEMVGKLRVATEPAASILTIANMPGNLSKAMEKVSAGYFAADQVRSAIQDEKILGISIKINEAGETKASVSGLTEQELAEWMKENNVVKSGESVEEILNIENQNNTENTNQNEQVQETNHIDELQETESSNIDQPQETESSNIEDSQELTSGPVATSTMAGTYSGSAILQHIEEDVESPDSLPVTLELNESGTGTVNVNGFSGEAQYAGNNVSFSVTMKDDSGTLNCKFDGTVNRNGSQVVISGNMYFSMMGIEFASYSWSAQK